MRSRHCRWSGWEKHLLINITMLSDYHQTYSRKPNSEIEKKLLVKKEELLTIFHEINWENRGDISIAVMGCGEKRFIKWHQRIFWEIFPSSAHIDTFDISITHLMWEENVRLHDCTESLPWAYDITYGHVLLKFIDTADQFSVLLNSVNALKPWWIAIHILDEEEITHDQPKLINGLFSVPIEKYIRDLHAQNINTKIIKLPYGIGLVISRRER